MRLSRGIAPWAVLFSCATLATCVFPTERDDSVRVTIEPLPVLVRGDETHATARAWHILAVADSQEIANVTFIWSSDDPLTATVDAAGHIVGIKSGTTAIRSEEHTSELQSRFDLVCRLLLEKKKSMHYTH